MNNVKDLEKQISEVLAQSGVELAYLHGSVATGKATAASDLDIAVVVSRNLSAQARFDLRVRLIEELSRSLRRECDVCLLNDTPSLAFRYLVVKNGRVIYAPHRGVRAEFESRVMGEYFDFRPFLNDYNAAYVSRNR